MMSHETPVIGTAAAPTPIVFTDAAAEKVAAVAWLVPDNIGRC